MVDMKEVLVFAVEGWRYALPAEQVVEVVRAVAAPPLPRAPEIVEGVIDYHGAVVPLLDLRSRFRLPPRPMALTDHLVVACAGVRLVAIRADHVLDLVRLPAEAVESPARFASGTEFVAGVARLPDGLVLIHDLATFLSEAESARLEAALVPEAARGSS